MSGEVNPVYSLNVFNFYFALPDQSRKSFKFVSGKLLGPANKQIKRNRESVGRNPLISFDQSIIKDNTRAQLTRISNSLGSRRLAFTLAIDSTKFAKKQKIPQKYKAIIGGIHPNNFITLDGLYNKELKEIVLILSDSFQLASKIKLVIISCQRVPIGM